MNFDYYLFIPCISVIFTFGYAALQDYKYKKLKLYNWIPMVVVSTPFVTFWYYTFFMELRDVFYMFFALLILICGIFYIVGRFKILGGGDSIGLIFMSICLPGHPITPLVGQVGVGVFPIAVIINACIFGLISFPILAGIEYDDDGSVGRKKTIPFMIPIFVAILFSLIFGDIFTVISNLFIGMSFQI